MIELFNDHYYIDFDEIEKVVNLEIIQSGVTVEQQIKFVKLYNIFVIYLVAEDKIEFLKTLSLVANG